MSYSELDDFLEKDNIVRAIEHWLNELQIDATMARALEIGGSGGLLAGMLTERFAHVICTDVVDWNSRYDGVFPQLLKQKFERNGRAFDYSRIEFAFGDAQNLVYKDNAFDVVFSLNTFEHIPEPAEALREVIRVTRPGGLIYLSFDPVWTADSGSHFLHHIGEPWAHLLHGDDYIAMMMSRSGATESEILSYRNDMNRLSASFYRSTMVKLAKECGASVVYENTWSGVVDEAHMIHPNLDLAAHQLDVSRDELLVRGFCFVFKKED